MNPDASSRESEVFPGRLARPSMFVGKELPPKASYGLGHMLVDENQNELIDLNNNFTTNIHGHKHTELDSVARRVISEGISFGLPTKYEAEHAELLTRRISGAERIKYTVTGTEAVMTAVRIARAVSGRSKIIMVDGAYHGSADSMIVAQRGVNRQGISSHDLDNIILVGLNETEELERAVDSMGGELAAILLDPMPNYTGLIPLSSEFMEKARQLSRDAGALLILDEIVNFRHEVGGLQSSYKVTPDLTTLGKLIGGGYPIGAVVGSAEAMSILAPERDGIPHGGTFSANPLAMAVGTRALELLDEESIQRLKVLGDQLRADLVKPATDAGWEVRGTGSLVRLWPQTASDSRPESRKWLQRLWWESYATGVLMTPSCLISLSTPMTHSVIADVGERLSAALRRASLT